MRGVQTLVQLSEELVQLLDRRASREGVSRASVIRAAIEAYLDTDALVDRQIVEGYRSQPQWADRQPELDSARRRRDAWAELDW
jgi:ribbon-helix-helix CopG family protein